mmetsp:Transcript_7905/g.15882  ORF Transcript_7905/g.15882 Transcript_7905/m.15882 type:complete len:505 (-) Transcript_7905:88-1602(-)
MLLLVSFFSCIGAFLFGYDLGLIAGALPLIRDDLNVSEVVEELIVSMAKLGAVVGTLIGATVMKLHGRRPALIWDVVFFLVGPFLMVVYPSGVALLVVGRFVIGLGIGVSAGVSPAYLGEISPNAYRGRIVGLYEFMLCFGMLSAALVNGLIDTYVDSRTCSWRLMVGLPMVPALFMGIFVWWIPESPRWLVSQGRLDEALRVMHKVHTSSTLPQGEHSSTAQVEAELLDLWSSVEKERSEQIDSNIEMNSMEGTLENDALPLLPDGSNDKSSAGNSTKRMASISPSYFSIFTDVYKLGFSDERRAYFVVLAIAFFNQACASTAIINYAPTVLEEKKGIESLAQASFAASATGVAKLLGAIVSISLVDRLGRKPLLVLGSIASSASLLLLSVGDALSSVPLMVTSMGVFIFFFSLSWGAIFWIILSEVFSMKNKSGAVATCTAALFLFGSAADALFLTIRSAIGFGSFIVYAFVSLSGGVFVYFCLPETKGKSLKEVQQSLRIS